MKDLHQMGTLHGFKHFSLYIRGKEELVVNVINEPTSYGSVHVGDIRCPITPGNLTSSPMIYSENDRHPLSIKPMASFTSGEIPYEKNRLMLSQTTQMKLSGYGDEGVGLPPASPSDQERTHNDPNATLFLLACYSRYGCPYVWVRSNHDRLVKLGRDTSDKDRDNPLKLKSTMNWRKQDIHISDILVEVVKLCAYPVPQNPLAVNFTYLQELADNERLLLTGTLLQTLEKVIMSAKEDKLYIAHVLEDYKRLTSVHMQTLTTLVKTGHLALP